MEAATYNQVSKDFPAVMDKVCNDHNPIIITRDDSRPVVMMSLEDYNSLEETACLVRIPATAERLRKSIKDYEEGRFQERELIEE